MTSFDSIKEASQKTGSSMVQIKRVISGKAGLAAGLQWKEELREAEKKDIQPIVQNYSNTAQAIYQIREDGEILCGFSSISKAAKETGVNSKSIRMALNGKQHTAGG